MRTTSKAQQIMLAAEKLFYTRRFPEFQMDEVPQAAGVGKGTICRYFRDKEERFLRTVSSGFAELCDLLQAPLREGAPAPARCRRACEQILAFFDRRRPLLQRIATKEPRGGT